jgi:hypothetical protein
VRGFLHGLPVRAYEFQFNRCRVPPASSPAAGVAQPPFQVTDHSLAFTMNTL